MGYHSLLQKRLLPFESNEARNLNIEVHKHIREHAEIATRKMAETFSGITYGSKIERVYTDGELFDLWSQGQIDVGAW